MFAMDFLFWILMGLQSLALIGLIVYAVVLATRLVNAVTRIADALERGE